MTAKEDQLQASESIFNTEADFERSKRERYELLVDEYVRAPLIIIWNDWRSRTGLIIILAYLLMGTVGVYLVEPPTSGQGERLLMPFQSLDHPLGTDQTGQDILSLNVHATPAMFKMIASGATVVVVLGTTFGLVSGFKGGLWDRGLSTISDVFLTIPGLPLIIVLAAIFEPRSPIVIGVILAVNAWAALARQIRSQVLSLRSLSYVEASQAMGISTKAILMKDILPNLMPYITINFVRSSWYIIFTSVALYFLGILPFSNLNWGVAMNLGYQSGALHSTVLFHTMAIPMVVIVVITLGLILFAQGADRMFNPRVRTRHTKMANDDTNTGER